MRIRLLIAATLLPTLVLWAAAASQAAPPCQPRDGEERLIFSDDFENGARQSPPPGWSMWGDAKFHVAADFTRDTSRAHGGAASFRIHHPANTGGYIVSSPGRALHPKPAMVYTVSFWARADKPGTVLFQ